MHIKVENLHKSFGSLRVLRGIDLEIMPGDLAVIVGGSGSGKSVLLKHLVGLLKPDSGRILVDGDDIVPKTEREMMDLRRRFGMIFQGGGMLQSLTVGENVGLALAELDHQRKRDVNEIVRKKLVQVGLEGRESQMPSTLSGGQRKRAAIARALTTDADCFLFDEPTAGLDPIMSANIDTVISDVNRETKSTTIVVTHDLISVLTIARKIYMLHDGVMIAAGTAEEFRNSKDKRVREFLARDLERDNPRRAGSAIIHSAGTLRKEQDGAGKTAVAQADDEDTSPDVLHKD